ncbi:MAG: PD-(D/E)XK nuclease family protein [Bacteroidales bacterium]|nr:PD-(D/E)XK nuclease family protein [Bacteroidales bacterium]
MEKQQKFLEKVADFLLKDSSLNFQETVVVFPNHRSSVFLKKYLQQKSDHNLWLPEMMTIDDLMVELSELTVINPLLVDLELYKVHQNIALSEARSIDDFLGWSTLMVNDFSDVDYYLADAGKLFSDLTDIKALEKWNLGIEPLTLIQKNYLEFFRSLGEYYTQLNNNLLSGKKAYKAMAYRFLAENIEEKISLGLNWKRFVFVGINALTPSEITVVKKLSEMYHVDYLIDADRFYFYNEKGNPSHEASEFLKKALSNLKIDTPQWIEDNLLSGEKDIEVKGVPKQMGQVHFAGRKLYEWITEKSDNLQNTAVVLADESLLMPLLSSVPVQIAGKPVPYNVTLGYPLTESALYKLIYLWFDLLINQQTSEGKFQVKKLIIFIKNPVLQIVSSEVSGVIEDELRSINSTFIDADTLLQLISKHEKSEHLILFFQSDFKAKNVFDILIGVMQKLQESIEDDQKLLRNQLMLTFSILKNLSVVLYESISELGLQALKKIILREMQKQKVNLKGEPLSGIQVMGLLETRNLDFENLIILSANEGILPRTGFQDSFIPFDLKRSYRLPLPNNKSAVYSYHVFRLLQRARNIVFVYNTEPDKLGGGEPSRFILQLEHELAKVNPKINFSKGIIPLNLDHSILASEITIERNQDVKEKLNYLAQTGISPSAINSFINCPLQFYLSYVLRVKIPDQPETAVESDTFGSVIHGVLQGIYKQFLGQNINPEILKEERKNIETYLNEQFLKYYGQSELKSGKNKLIYRVALEYLLRYLDSEIRNVQNRKLLGVEVDVSHQLQLGSKVIRFKGKIDRIDQFNNTIQIIDYKTGRVDPKDVNIKSMDEIFTDVKFSKALQVSCYAWLYNKKYPSENDLQSGLISLRSSKSEVFNVSFGEPNIKSWVQQFEEAIYQLLNLIFEDEKPFMQTHDDTHCRYCDFKNICNR